MYTNNYNQTIILHFCSHLIKEQIILLFIKLLRKTNYFLNAVSNIAN